MVGGRKPNGAGDAGDTLNKPEALPVSTPPLVGVDFSDLGDPMWCFQAFGLSGFDDVIQALNPKPQTPNFIPGRPSCPSLLMLNSRHRQKIPGSLLDTQACGPGFFGVCGY